MNAYLALFDDGENILMVPHLHEIIRDKGGRYWLVAVQDGDEFEPHAVYRCPDEAVALALLRWIDEYGEDGVAKPENYEERCREWRDKMWLDPAAFGRGVPDDYPRDLLRYTQASNSRPQNCLLLFRNGEPRKAKGGAS